MRWLVAAAAFLVACSGGEPQPEPTPPPESDFDSAGRVTVVYTNNIDGEIEPCG